MTKPCSKCGTMLKHGHAISHECPADRPAPQPVDTCIEHGPGGTIRLSFQIRVF